MRTRYTTLITSLFLPNDQAEPHNVPLPNAPYANPDITLPIGGINLQYGHNAPRLLSAAMQKAIAMGYRPYNATITAEFGQPLGTKVTADNLAQSPVLALIWPRISKDLAEDIHQRLLSYLTSERIKPDVKYSPIAFELATAFPDLLHRLIQEKPYQHLQGICYPIPGVGSGPPSQMFYLRNLDAIKRIQTLSSNQEQPMFRLPTAEELQSPPATFNPFLDEPASGVGDKPAKTTLSLVSPSN